MKKIVILSLLLLSSCSLTWNKELIKNDNKQWLVNTNSWNWNISNDDIKDINKIINSVENR